MNNTNNQPVNTRADSKKSNKGLIIGLVVGGILIFIVLPIVAFCGLFFSIINVGQEIMQDVSLEIHSDEDGNVDIDLNNRDKTKENYVAGIWNCAKGNGSKDDKENFSTTLELNDDMTYRYGKYGDIENNHYAGEYSYKKEDKQTSDGRFKYYMVDMDVDEFIDGGVDKSDEKSGSTQLEMGIANVDNERQAITIFTSTYNMYYCYAK